jgi:hypothetical protein
MSTLLYSLRSQQGGCVRILHLHLQQSWVGAVEAWRELGKLTWLDQLALEFGKEVGGVLLCCFP